SLALLVELAAFVALRATAPLLPRPWRVPGGHIGALAVTLPPALFALAAIATAGWGNTLAGVAAALSGPFVWWIGRPGDSRRWRRPGSRASAANRRPFSIRARRGRRARTRRSQHKRERRRWDRRSSNRPRSRRGLARARRDPGQ